MSGGVDLGEMGAYLSPRPCHTTNGRGEGLLVDVAGAGRSSVGVRGCCGMRAAEAVLRIAKAPAHNIDPLAMIIKNITMQ